MKIAQKLVGKILSTHLNHLVTKCDEKYRLRLSIKPLLTVFISLFLLFGCGGGGESGNGTITVNNYQSILSDGFEGYSKLFEITDSLINSGNNFGPCESGAVSNLSSNYTYDNCIVGEYRYDGAVDLIVLRTNSDDVNNSEFHNKTIVFFENFSGQTDDWKLNNANGALDITESAQTLTFTAGGIPGELSLSYDKDGRQKTIDFRSLSLSLNKSESTGAKSLHFDMVQNQIVDGKEITVTFSTPDDLIIVDGEEFPRDGSIRVTSSAGGKIIITANNGDTDSAKVQVDIDGDEAFELSVNQLWEDIFGEIPSQIWFSPCSEEIGISLCHSG